jgi:hypothetical protein
LFRFDDLSPGDWQVAWVNANTIRPNHELRTTAGTAAEGDGAVVRVAAGAVARCDVDLGADEVPFARIRMKCDGHPASRWIATWQVRSRELRAMPDEEGVMIIKSSRAGEVEVRVRCLQRADAELTLDLKVHTGQNNSVLDLVVPCGDLRLEGLSPEVGKRSQYALRIPGPYGGTWTVRIPSKHSGSVVVRGIPAGPASLQRRVTSEAASAWRVVGHTVVTAERESTHRVVPK